MGIYPFPPRSSGWFGVVGQVMGLYRWIGVSWVRWWRGFGSVEIGGFGLWRLVSFSVGFWVDLGVTGAGFWIWDRRGLAEIRDSAVMCVVCVWLPW